MTRSNSEQVAMTTAATISPTQLAGDIITVPGGITTAAWPPGRYKVNSICSAGQCGVWLLFTFSHLLSGSGPLVDQLFCGYL